MPFFDRFRKKKPDKASKAEHAARHCFVLCNSDAPRDLSNAASIVSDVFGEGYSADYDEKNIVTVARGDETIGFLAHMPAAIPGGEAEENADGNFLWPEGRAEAGTHCAHVIVTNIGAGEQSPIQSAIAVSRLALVAGIDRIIDMIRTATNVTGQILVPTLVARFTGQIEQDSPLWRRPKASSQGDVA